MKTNNTATATQTANKAPYAIHLDLDVIAKVQASLDAIDSDQSLEQLIGEFLEGMLEENSGFFEELGQAKIEAELAAIRSGIDRKLVPADRKRLMEDMADLFIAGSSGDAESIDAIIADTIRRGQAAERLFRLLDH